MARKKEQKLELDNLGPLQHNPFASLGQQFGVEAKAETSARTPKSKAPQPGLMIRLEKRKKGKMATCIYHLNTDSKDLLKQLKQKLGTGGTLGEEAVELQGDHREKAADFLREKGFKVRVI